MSSNMGSFSYLLDHPEASLNYATSSYALGGTENAPMISTSNSGDKPWYSHHSSATEPLASWNLNTDALQYPLETGAFEYSSSTSPLDSVWDGTTASGATLSLPPSLPNPWQATPQDTIASGINDVDSTLLPPDSSWFDLGFYLGPTREWTAADETDLQASLHQLTAPPLPYPIQGGSVPQTSQQQLGNIPRAGVMDLPQEELEHSLKRDHSPDSRAKQERRLLVQPPHREPSDQNLPMQHLPAEIKLTPCPSFHQPTSPSHDAFPVDRFSLGDHITAPAPSGSYSSQDGAARRPVASAASSSRGGAGRRAASTSSSRRGTVRGASASDGSSHGGPVRNKKRAPLPSKCPFHPDSLPHLVVMVQQLPLICEFEGCWRAFNTYAEFLDHLICPGQNSRYPSVHFLPWGKSRKERCDYGNCTHVGKGIARHILSEEHLKIKYACITCAKTRSRPFTCCGGTN